MRGIRQLRLWEPKWVNLIAKIRAEPPHKQTSMFNGKPWPGL